MPRPRRILRFLLKAAATLLFVLGLTLLVAWPVSHWWSLSANYSSVNAENPYLIGKLAGEPLYGRYV